MKICDVCGKECHHEGRNCTCVEAPVAPSRSAAPPIPERLWCSYPDCHCERENDGKCEAKNVMTEHADNSQVAEIIGPILRKTGIACWKHGRTGMLMLMKKLGETKIQLEQASAAPPSEREVAMISALERVWDSRHEPDKWSLEVSRALELATGKPHPFRTALKDKARAAAVPQAALIWQDVYAALAEELDHSMAYIKLCDERATIDGEVDCEEVAKFLNAKLSAAVPAPAEQDERIEAAYQRTYEHAQEQHKTVPIQVWADVDEGIVEIVRHLNTIPGVRTQASCQGTDKYAAYIMAEWPADVEATLKEKYDLEFLGEHWGYVRARAGATAPPKEGK